MANRKLNRKQLLAAEIFGYSYAKYQDSLEVGKIRFTKLMPQDAEKLEKACQENWDLGRVAKEFDVDTDTAAIMMLSTRNAIEVIDAKTPAEAFRVSVRQLLDRAATAGLDSDEAVEKLVIQVCYRVSDLSRRLIMEGSQLSKYCKYFRETPDNQPLDLESDSDQDDE